jgi:hypothetical protein
LDQWRERAESELNKMPELTTRLAAAEQALRDYKIYDDVNLPPLSNGNPAPPQSRPFNPPQPTQPAGLTRDEAASYIRDLTLLNGKANQIGIRHMKLFGEPLEDDLVTHYLTTGEDMEQHWRIKHGVDQRQRDLQAKQEADREAAMRERIRSELMTELSMDPSRITGVPTSTFGRNTPLFETYAAKSAQHHAQNNADDTGTGDFIRPEMKPDIAASRDRQAKASRMFSENFDAYGNPTTDKGKQLSHRYGSA